MPIKLSGPKCFLFLFCLAMLPQLTNAQPVRLTKVTALRLSYGNFMDNGKWDSAVYCLRQVVTDSVYANAVDYLNLAHCAIRLKAIPAFNGAMSNAIKGGADSGLIVAYNRKLTGGDSLLLQSYLKEQYPSKRKEFLSRTDTGLIAYMDQILLLDQLVRSSKFGDTNWVHIQHIGRYTDSVNFLRIKELIRQGHYPGFHNVGILSSRYDFIAAHATDHNEEEWNFIFSFLKRQVLSGDMQPNTLVAIATRHYQSAKNCTWYGSQRRGALELCDCQHVDEYRSEIGLDRLEDEYKRINKALPDCYRRHAE